MKREAVLFTNAGEVVVVDVAEMVGGWMLLRVRKESGYSILTVPVDYVSPELLSVYFSRDNAGKVWALLGPAPDDGAPDGS